MKTVSIFKLRDNLGFYLDLVKKTNTPIVVEKYNTPTAMITPYKEGLVEKSLVSYFGFLGKGEDGNQFVNKIRRSKKEKQRIQTLRNPS